MTEVAPEDVVSMARASGARSVSWTYNEPIIWHEFTTTASKAVHEAGLKTNYVTNGYIQEEPLRELKGVIDAMNIDVKAFTEGFYKEICGGKLRPVLDSCQLAVEMGIHVELTYLIIPTKNDAEEEIEGFCKWIVDSLGRQIPVHFSAFHPDYKLTNLSRTPTGTLSKAYKIAKKSGIDFVYVGNVYVGDEDDTFCPKCGTRVVDRDGFWVRSTNLKGSSCGKCGAGLNMIV